MCYLRVKSAPLASFQPNWTSRSKYSIFGHFVCSLSLPIVGGGFCDRASAHTSLGFFLACSKPTYLALISQKTYFVFTPNSIFHKFSDLIDHQNQPSPLYFAKFWLSFFCTVLIQIYQKCCKISFTVYQTTPLTQKTSQNNNLSRSQKGGGGDLREE